MSKASRKAPKKSKVSDTLFVVGTVIATAMFATFLGYLVGMYGIQRLTGTSSVPRVRSVEVTGSGLTKKSEAQTPSDSPLMSSETSSNSVSSSSSQGERTRLYRVQVGSFSVRSNADNLVKRLKKEVGLDAIVVGTGPYRVQVGAFSDRSNAERLQKELASKGYETLIVK